MRGWAISVTKGIFWLVSKKLICDVHALLVTNLTVDVNKGHQNTVIPKTVIIIIADNENW